MVLPIWSRSPLSWFLGKIYTAHSRGSVWNLIGAFFVTIKFRLFIPSWVFKLHLKLAICCLQPKYQTSRVNYTAYTITVCCSTYTRQPTLLACHSWPWKTHYNFEIMAGGKVRFDVCLPSPVDGRQRGTPAGVRSKLEYLGNGDVTSYCRQWAPQASRSRRLGVAVCQDRIVSFCLSSESWMFFPCEFNVARLCWIFRLCSHYFVNGGFFRCDEHIFEDVPKIRHIPGTIIQGRYDVVCPAETAWKLHKVCIGFPMAYIVHTPRMNLNSLPVKLISFLF